MKTYIPTHFKLEELVPKQIFTVLGQEAWKLLDSRALEMLDSLRQFFNVPIIVNDWYKGGSIQFDCANTGDGKSIILF